MSRDVPFLANGATVVCPLFSPLVSGYAEVAAMRDRRSRLLASGELPGAGE
jgi:hypothetical protein